MTKVKLQQFYSNVLLDLALSFFVRGAVEAGWTEKQALEKFMAEFIMPEVEDPEQVLMIYIRLKKMLQETI